ncbi:MAG: peptidylprolyl isomerase [Deltaproteobacteria bacterium]|nr:peptidylprolyl isomerase [Deltaproteobacteria bacterium]
MQEDILRWLLVVVAVLGFLSMPLIATAEELKSPEVKSKAADPKAAPAASVGEKKVADAKAAVVNGTVISRDDYEKELGRAQQQFFKMGKPPAEKELNELRKEVMDNLINRELLYQECQKKGIKADEAAVEGQIKSIKERFPNEAEYKNTLLKMGMTEEGFKTQMKREMCIKQYIDKEFLEKAKVDEKEMRAYYDAHPDYFKKPEQVKASHILIKSEPGDDAKKKAEARKKLEEIEKKIKAGGDFAALAKENSQCPSAAQGGDLGVFGRGQMVKPFEDAAFALKPGEMSGIVETNFGYHLIKLTEKQNETKVSFDEVKPKLTEYLKQEKAQKDLKQYLDKVRTTAKVEILVPEAKGK